MSVEDKFARDPRLLHLAKLQGWSKREAGGCIVLEVWPLCYDRVSPYLRRIDIELATGSDSLAENMIRAGLATETRHGLRIAGASERIEYLRRAKESGQRGGKASGKARASNAPLRRQADERRGSTNPSASAPDLAPDPVLALVPEDGPRNSASTHRPAVDAFDRYYKAKNDGARPTWDGTRIAMIKGLVKKHTCDEVIRRIAILSDSPPTFPPSPWDLSTFVQHFDKCAASKTATGIGRFDPKDAKHPPAGTEVEL